MGQERCCLVAVLIERVIHRVRMIRDELRAKRQELAANRVGCCILPVDAGEHIRR